MTPLTSTAQHTAAIARAVQQNTALDYLPLRRLIEQQFGRQLLPCEKKQLEALLRSTQSADLNTKVTTKVHKTGPRFTFVLHPRDRNGTLCSSTVRSGKYALMSDRERTQQLSSMEKQIIAPAFSKAARYGLLTRLVKLSAFEEPCSLCAASGEIAHGTMRATPFLPKDYFHPATRKSLLNLLKRMVVNDVRDASTDQSTFTVGLGALNKNITFSGNGKVLADVADTERRERTENGLPSRKVCVVTGNTMTAAVVLANIMRYVPTKSEPIFVNGATSNIGKPVVMRLVGEGYTAVTFHSSSEERAQKLLAAVAAHCGADAAGTVSFTTDASVMWGFKYCVIGSSYSFPERPAAQRDTAPPMFLGFAFPLPKDMDLAKPNCVDIGKLQLPESMKLRNNMGCERREMYACFSGAAVHSAMGWEHHEVGDIDVAAVSVCFKAAIGLGFSLPPQKHYQQDPAVSTRG